jgi:hypothetical protein
MFLGLPDPHPVSLVRGTDPRILIRIQIRIKMSRIRNTGLNIQSTVLYCILVVHICAKYAGKLVDLMACPHGMTMRHY